MKYVATKRRLQKVLFSPLAFLRQPTFQEFTVPETCDTLTAKILSQRRLSVEISSDMAPFRTQINQMMTEIYFIYAYEYKYTS
jgi:hypothetical protein